MRNSIRIAAIGTTALAALSLGSVAQAAGTASATATAQVLSTVAVTKTRDLAFGQIAVNGNGNIVMNADGTGTCPAAIICTGTRNSAAFTVTGTAGTGVTANVTQTSIDLTHATDTTKKFTLDSFTVDFPAGSTLTSGVAVFNVGGTLHVTTAAALAGLYTGTFNVNVEYQ
jgi:hypothetical protein